MSFLKISSKINAIFDVSQCRSILSSQGLYANKEHAGSQNNDRRARLGAEYLLQFR